MVNKYILIGIGIALFLFYIGQRFFRKDDEYEKLYNEVLNSDKYKVKGQYD